MVRYYEIAPNRDAWGTSLVIHAWVLALLLFIPAIKPPAADEPLAPPLEITILDLGPPGDRLRGEDTRPAPKPAVLARVHQVPETRPIERPAEPAPAEVREAPVPVAPPAAAPPIDEVREPDPVQVAAEDARRRAVEQERRQEIDQTAGSPVAAAGGAGESDQEPPSGGAVGTGQGATGDLSGRRVLRTVKPVYPPAALARHSEGLVLARIRVGPDGRVAEADILRSAGDPDIDEAALAAFRRWRFSPLPAGVPPVDQVGEVRMTFELQ